MQATRPHRGPISRFVRNPGNGACFRIDNFDRRRQARPRLFNSASMFLNEIMIDVIKFPFDVIGVDHPELALIRIAAVNIQLLARLESSALDSAQLLFDGRT